jgi:hypothetical protein
MKLLNNPKIITVLSYVAFLLLAFAVFSAVRNRELLIDSETVSFGMVYILLIGVILFASVIFGFTLKVINSYNDELKTLDVEMDVLVAEEENTLTEEVEITHDIKIKDKDKKEIIRKIIPVENNLSLLSFTEQLMQGIANEFDIVVGIAFVREEGAENYNPYGKYAYFAEQEPAPFKLGETLSGQAAKNKTPLKLDEIPEDYINVVSGLGSAIPRSLLILPVVFEDKCIAVLEIGTFTELEAAKVDVLKDLTVEVGPKLNGIKQ